MTPELAAAQAALQRAVMSTGQGYVNLGDALAAIGVATATLAALLEEDDPDPPGALALEVVAATWRSITVGWTFDGPDPAGWTIGRDGVDTDGTGAWSTRLAGTARSLTFSALRSSTEYTVTLTPDGAEPVSVKATTAAGLPSPVDPPADGDGIQAAVLQGWGFRIDGDEFEQSTDGRPLADRWGLYDGKGHGGNGRRTPAAWSVRDGVLVCRGDRDGNTGGMAFKRWSGRTYRVEARMRLVNVGAGSGAQYHPVLIMWPDGDDWPRGGEDDFAETDIGTGRMKAFIHHPNQGSGSAQSVAEKTLDITGWHNYAAERTSTSVTGWIDGVQWFRFTNREVLGVPKPLHGCVQLDNFGGNPHRPAEQQLQWFRIYKPPT